MAVMIWAWLILSYLSLFILGFSDNLRGPLFPEILKHFQISDTKGALFFSLTSLVSFLFSLMAIPILNRMSFLRLLQWALVMMSMALLGFSQAPDFAWFLGAAALLGAAMGFMGVAQNSLATRAAPRHLRGQVLSGLHSMYGLASFIAPLIVGIGLEKGRAWNDYFILASLLALAVVLLSFALPKVNPTSQVEEKDHPGAPVPKSLSLWLSLMIGFYVIAEILVGTRLSLYSIREYHISSAQASQHVTLFYLGLLSARIAGIFIRWPGSSIFQLATSLIISLVGYGLGLYVSPWFFALTGLGMSIFYPTSLAYASQFFPKSEGVIFSLIMAAQSILIVSMHLGVGFVSDLWSIKVAFHLGLVFLLIAAFCLWRVEVEKSR